MNSSPTVDVFKINQDSGDLGLGRGWKPGAIPRSESDDESDRPEELTEPTLCMDKGRKNKRDGQDANSHHSLQKTCPEVSNGRLTEMCGSSSSCSLDTIDNDGMRNSFIRGPLPSQQNGQELTSVEQTYHGDSRKNNGNSMKVFEVSQKKQEQPCQIHEMNQLQFEMDYRQAHFSSSQEIWTIRYAKLSEENSILQKSLEARSEELKKLSAAKVVLVRERDELLALLDVQERERYESMRPCTEHQPYDGFSSAELAILGACQCRHKSPDPCLCAYAASNLNREIAALKEQIMNWEKQHKDSLLTTDAYRTAFEDQLGQNKNLVRELAEVTAVIMNNNSKSAKFRAAMKFLLQQLNEDLPPSDVNGDMQEYRNEKEFEEKTEHSLILRLVDMVSDKNEALAHQKLAARLMAKKVNELEQELNTVIGNGSH